MKKNFFVKKWPPELALEEVEMEIVPFCVQIKGVPLCLVTMENVKHLTKYTGVFLEMEDPAKAREFLKVKILVNTVNPLASGCWLKRETNRETWVEFRYNRLQYFCYRCGRVGQLIMNVHLRLILEGQRVMVTGQKLLQLEILWSM